MGSGRLGRVVTASALLGAGLVGTLVSVLASAEPAKGNWLPPLPASSASAAGSVPVAKAPSSAASAGAAPPGYMYQDQWIPPSGEEPPPSSPRGSPPTYPAVPGYRRVAPPGYYPYPPPPYGYPGYPYEPPPPPPPRHRVSNNSLWLGVRGGVLFPAGHLYDEGTDYYYYPYGLSWSDVAGSGPLFELNLGGRFARRYIVFAAWEHAVLGTGSDSNYQMLFGSQTSARTDFAGLGFRWSSNPDDVGLALELGLGYRWFKERWAGGYRLSMEGFGEFRLGLGADVRVSRALAISPMLTVSEGVFNDRNQGLPGQPMQPIRSYSAAHQTLTLTLGAHFDLLGNI
jgi:hypothetical protein